MQGGAPKASLMDLGNFYSSFAAEDHYMVAALGYDGIETPAMKPKWPATATAASVKCGVVGAIPAGCSPL